ncbi:peptide deformylase [Cyanobium sp. ATX 6A2]|nr:peptide deformylase [Cyanobium sp. ATX 6A2]
MISGQARAQSWGVVITQPLALRQLRRKRPKISRAWPSWRCRSGMGFARDEGKVSVSRELHCCTAPAAPPIPETVLINPRITPLSPERSSAWEGCLSVPGMRGLVPRWEQIRYQGVDSEGNQIDRSVDGFHARVVQHECDHLDGVLYTDRIEERTAFGFTKELEAAGVLPSLPPE